MELFFKDINIKIDNKLKELSLKGFLGAITLPLHGTDLVLFSSKIFFKSLSSYRILHNKLISYVDGLNQGYFVELNLVGLGFRFIKIGNYLLIKLGYSHYIKFIIPKNIHVFGFKRRLIIFGIDKEEVSRIANILRSFRKPDAYKGKGIQLNNENLKFKVGKQK
jgi:large subunit ribosomal protein L6